MLQPLIHAQLAALFQPSVCVLASLWRYPLIVVVIVIAAKWGQEGHPKKLEAPI
jgi:hypothetical protein